jgi:fumarylacetoacetase
VIVDRDVRRPLGQFRARDKSIQYGPEPMLDFELEMGAVLRVTNSLGEPLAIRDARDAIFGYCLLNDWSARGIQFLEQAPLGPFLGKSFATSISPWLVTEEALAPFRAPARAHAEGAPTPSAHLIDADDQASGNLNVRLEGLIRTAQMRAAGQEPMVLVRTNALVSYWTFAQMVTHLASNGCNVQAGDLIGSGTMSGPEDDSMACLVEWVVARKTPITLPGGETRTYLQDGDEVIFRGRAEAPGRVAIGFGECRGQIAPAPALAKAVA